MGRVFDSVNEYEKSIGRHRDGKDHGTRVIRDGLTVTIDAPNEETAITIISKVRETVRDCEGMFDLVCDNSSKEFFSIYDKGMGRVNCIVGIPTFHTASKISLSTNRIEIKFSSEAPMWYFIAEMIKQVRIK